MKIQTHILMAFLALVISACASKENLSQAKLDQQEEQDQYSRNQFEAASRFR